MLYVAYDTEAKMPCVAIDFHVDGARRGMANRRTNCASRQSSSIAVADFAVKTLRVP
jgi:hypothetical protein